MRTRHEGDAGISAWLGMMALAFALGFVLVTIFLFVPLLLK